MTHVSVKDHRIPWDTLHPFQQWVWLIQNERPPEVAIEELHVNLLSYEPAYGSEAWGRIVRPTMDVNARQFFGRHFRTVLRRLPLVAWPHVLRAYANIEATRFLEVHERLFEFAESWRAIAGGSGPVSEELAGSLVDAISDLVGWSRLENVKFLDDTLPQVNPEDIPEILLQPLPVLITRLADPGRAMDDCLVEALDLQGAMRAAGSSGIFLNIVAGTPQCVSSYLVEASSTRDIVLLDEDTLKRLLLAERPLRAVRATLLAHLGLGRLNPYVAVGPVKRPEMFFGRQSEIRAILSDQRRDFFVIGTRQIGKTSLCAYLQRRCESPDPRKPIYIDVATLSGEKALIRELTLRIAPHRSERMTIGRFEHMIETNATLQSAPYLFLLDEIDSILVSAAQGGDWRFFEILRSLSHKGLVQTVFTGYRVLYEHWLSLDSPLFNYGTPIYLSILDQRSARQLITEPLRAIGVTFNESDRERILEHIVTQTGCHPSFVQVVCELLVEQLDEAPTRRREINWADMECVDHSARFETFILRPFLAQGNLSEMDQLVMLLAANADRNEFHIDWLSKVIGDCQVDATTSEIVRSLKHLEIAGLVRRMVAGKMEPGAYRVSLPAFPRVLRKSRNVSHEISQVARSLRRT